MYTAGQSQFGSFYFLVDDAITGELVHYTRGRTSTPLMLTIAITGEGFRLGGNDDELRTYDEITDVAEAMHQVPTLPCRDSGRCGTPDDYDWPGLRALLSRLKDRHPSESGVILIPEAGVPYDVLIRTADTCQWEDGPGGGAGRGLFPFVVIASGASDSHAAPGLMVAGREQVITLSLDGSVSALASSLPAIGAPKASSDGGGRRETVVVEYSERSDARRGRRKAEMMQQGLAALIGTTGEVGSGAAGEDLLADTASLDAALASAGGIRVARRGSEEGAGRDGDGGHAAARAAGPGLRAWFPETFVFEPLVLTDEQGHASVDVTVPDQLTTWRVLGLAHSGTGSQAGTVHQLASTLPAYVEIAPPAQLRAGDRLALPVLVVNNSTKRFNGRLHATAEGDAVRGDTSAAVALQPFDSQVRTLNIEARSAGVATLTATLDGVDAVRRPLAVVPAGRPVVRSSGGTLGAPREVELPDPGGPPLDGSTLELVVYPGPMAVVAAEMELAPARGAQLSDVAYATMLVGRGPAVAARMNQEIDKGAVRTARLEAYQLLVRHTRAPSPQQAVIALMGAAELDDPMAAGLAARLASGLADQQSPDGSFAAAWGGGVSLEQALVFVAEVSRACSGIDDQVAQRAGMFCVRNTEAVRDPYTAALLLGANLVGERQRPALREQIVSAVVQREDGSKVVRPGEMSARLDGSVPSETETTARAIVALQDDAESRDLVADLGSSLLSAYRKTRGFGDGIAGMAAMEALSVMLDEPLPDRVEIRLLAGDENLVVESVDLTTGAPPLIISVPAPDPGAPLRLEAAPAVPGLIYTITRVDWLRWQPTAPSEFALRVTVPPGARVGRRASLALEAAAPANEPFTITLELPAGLDVDTDGLEGLIQQGTLESYEANPGLVRLVVPGHEAGATFGVSFDVIPTLAGTLQWGAATLALERDPDRRVQHRPDSMRIQP